MSETPVENGGFVKPGVGQTEKMAPDGSTVVPVDHEISEAEQQRRYAEQPGSDTPQNKAYDARGNTEPKG